MVHLARLLTFLVFVGLGSTLLLVERNRGRRAWINVFICYVLALNVFVAAGQKDGWPFSPYALMTADSRERGIERSMIAFRAVDAHDREWDVEPLAWSPLFPTAVMGWFEVAFPRASPAEREEVGRFLLDRAEAARLRRREGAWIGNQRILGPLAAPDPHISRAARGAAPDPLVALRVYRLTWIAEEMLRDPGAVRRRVLYEYRRR